MEVEPRAAGTWRSTRRGHVAVLERLHAGRGSAPEQRRGAVERLSIANEHGGITGPIVESLVASIDRPPVSHDGNLDGAGLLPQVERPGILVHRGCAVFHLDELQRVVNAEMLQGVERQVGRR